MIVINGVKWKVQLVSPFHPGLLRSDRVYALGSCDYPLKTIYLSEDISDTYLRKVLCHELVHAFMFSYGVVLDSETEEVFADLVSQYGRQIINTTERVVRWVKKIKGTS